MELKEVYLLARNNTYKDFKEEIDHRITGQLRTNVSEHEFEVKLILPEVIRQSEQLVCKDCGNTGRSYPTLGEPDGVKCESCAN